MPGEKMEILIFALIALYSTLRRQERVLYATFLTMPPGVDKGGNILG
jgi:hypothetical protein